MYNIPYSSFIHRECFDYIFLSHSLIHFSYNSYRVFCQVCIWMLCALQNFFRMGMASVSDPSGKPVFFLSIESVFMWSSNKNMIRIYTSGIIAFMANKMFFWNFPKMKLIRKSMSGLGSFINFKFTIPARTNSPNPVPTMFSFINVVPKSFVYVNFLRFVTALSTAIFRPTINNIYWNSVELFATYFTSIYHNSKIQMIR